jgi:hypothetical protein
MNKSALVLEQPAFVEEIIRKVCNHFLSPIFLYAPGGSTDVDKMPKTEREYVITPPDYTLSIGNNNMLRTSIHIANKQQKIEVSEGSAAPVIPVNIGTMKPEFIERVAHISNLQHKEEGTNETSIVVVFQTNTQNPKAYPVTVTRHYVSKEYLDNKFIKVAYRDIGKIDDEIYVFLVDGKTPA